MYIGNKKSTIIGATNIEKYLMYNSVKLSKISIKEKNN